MPEKMDKLSKIYIAGHRGLVGSSIIRTFQSLGYANIITRTHSELDLTRQKDVEKFFDKEQPDYVFLAAAKVGGILANNTYKADFIYENIMIAANVINTAYKYGVKKLLNLGSSCIYPKFAPQPMHEDCLLTDTLESTNESYAIAKISAIKLCRYYNEQYGSNFISAMPTNLYGPNDNYNLKTSHVLPAMIRKFHLAKLLQKEDYNSIKMDFTKYGISCEKVIEMLTADEIINILEQYGINDQYITLWGSGSPYREFLYSDDLAEACFFLMQRCDAGEIGELINVGVGRDIRIKELSELVKGIVGFSGEINWDSTIPDGTPKKLLNVDKINKLGWKAKTELDKGIELAYEDYKRDKS